MMRLLKYGLVTVGSYIFVIVAILTILTGVDILTGKCNYQIYLTPAYLVFFSVGFVISFLFGFCFPLFLSRGISEYSMEYPDVPDQYVYDICRGKLLMQYYHKLALISLLLTIPLFLFLPEQYSLMVYILGSSCSVFFTLYYKYKKQYKDL